MRDTIAAIVSLAEEIGRTSPESAAKAMQIAELARSLSAGPDREAIRDALDAEADDLSDAAAVNAATAVERALKE